jgi:hypothetical protein
MAPTTHLARIILLMACVAGFLGWTGKNSAILFADGLRYIDQAKKLDAGQTFNALFRSIDHPAYPLAIVGVHRMIGGESPIDWQRAAQGASIVAGLLLVIPLYLIALEMFGGATAWLAVVLSYLVPLTGHVMADALSESLFLLFFMLSVWTSLRFLKVGTFIWLPPTIFFAALAYWVRPEGLLLPASMVATLAIVPLMSSTRMVWPRWWAAVAFRSSPSRGGSRPGRPSPRSSGPRRHRPAWPSRGSVRSTRTRRRRRRMFWPFARWPWRFATR